MGQRLPDHLVDYININSDLAELSFEFSLQIDDDNIHVYYDVELARNKVTSDSNTDNIDSIKTIPIVKKKKYYSIEWKTVLYRLGRI